MGNIFGAKTLIESALSGVIPKLRSNKSVESYLDTMLEAMEDLKQSCRRCVFELENSRREMFEVSKKMMILRDQIRDKHLKKE